VYLYEMAAAAEVIKSNTRRDTLVLDGFMYVRNAVKGERIYWECIEKRPYRCFGRAVTMNDKTYCSREHTHPPDLAKIELRKAEELCRDRAVTTDSHASTIITSVVKMLPPKANPYITTTNLMKTIRRARKTAMTRLNKTYENTTTMKKGLTNNNLTRKRKLRRSVGSLLEASSSGASGTDNSSSMIVFSDAFPEATDFKPSNFLEMRSQLSSQLPCKYTDNKVNNSSLLRESCENLNAESMAKSETSAKESNSTAETVPDSAQRPLVRDRDCSSPTEDDVLREFMALDGAVDATNHSSTPQVPEAEKISRTPDVLTVRRQRPVSGSQLKGRLSSAEAGGSKHGPLLLKFQGRRCSNNVASIRLDTLLDGRDMHAGSFIVRGNGLEDASRFGLPSNSSSANVGSKMLSLCQSRTRKSTPELTVSPSSPFRPTLDNIPITKNMRYIDSGLTFCLIAPDLDGPSNERFVIFSTERCLGMLEWHEWAVDVDLFALPDAFVYGQLLTIYARIEGHNLRCAWILLSSRTTELCVRALKALQSKEKILEPKIIFTDYDNLLLIALEMAFPNAQIKGSFDHLRRRLFDEIEKNKLQQLCPSYSTLIEKIKLFLAIAFVSSNWTLFAFREFHRH
uniref:MULE transposase domain-containing protein n=2 Tax=Parascaris univalens TaxID=6257 RepID=A0A915C7B9_PARUN